MGAQMVALGRGTGTLEIQLSREAVVYFHAAQREIALVGVRLREAGRSPLRFVKVFCVRQVILAGTRGQTAGAEACSAIANLADLARARNGSIPGKPGSGEHVFATEQDTADSVIGPADLRVERRHAGAALNSGRWVNAAAIGALQLNAARKLGRVQNRGIVGQ